jgi:hypothetical protein
MNETSQIGYGIWIYRKVWMEYICPPSGSVWKFLPEDEESVLVFLAEENMTIGAFCENDWRILSADWHPCSSDEQDEEAEVTHWMPLPECP